MKQYTIETKVFYFTSIKTYVDGKFEKEIKTSCDDWYGVQKTLEALGYKRAYTDDQIRSKEAMVKQSKHELEEMKKYKIIEKRS